MRKLQRSYKLEERLILLYYHLITS